MQTSNKVIHGGKDHATVRDQEILATRWALSRYVIHSCVCYIMIGIIMSRT